MYKRAPGGQEGANARRAPGEKESTEWFTIAALIATELIATE